ncbi:MAG: HD domain-containing protein, partial [Campylobacterota bacterium]|nr:HD domain-containing protein [Campylobacterota bacterium]
EDKILQTRIINRLFFITQNALAYFAYPSINTKRYIHSLGTMHLSAHIFKNSLLNSKTKVRDKFLKKLKTSIEVSLKQSDISLGQLSYFNDTALNEYMISLKMQKSETVYFIALQAIRVAGLLHDVGHFPFSHQVEYAMQKIYANLQYKKELNKKEKEFLNFYEKTTSNSEHVLHEAIGTQFIKMLFEYELLENEEDHKQKVYNNLIYKIVLNILNDTNDGIFDYGVLHRIIDGTVDADRLDYINRDMLASGYISGGLDFRRITKQAVLVENRKKFLITFFDGELIDIEHMLEMRFNLYKKVIFNHKISLTDALLENVILFLAQNYFEDDNSEDIKQTDSISMLWRFLEEKDRQKALDIISQLDENWLITLFKKEYFNIKYKKEHTFNDKKYIVSFEEVLFGKKFYTSVWKNLNDLYNELEFDKNQRYRFRESFGYVNKNRFDKLQKLLERFCKKYEDSDEDIFFTYRIVSLNIGIDKDFSLYDEIDLIKIDEISTLRKRLKNSILNTVPFYLYSNSPKLNEKMKDDIKEILHNVFL